MANLHFRVPVTLDIRIDADDPVARVHKWRTWPKEQPPEDDALLLRFNIREFKPTVSGFFQGDDIFIDSFGTTIFLTKGCRLSELDPEDLVFREPPPDEIHWIPLGELLEGVEDAEVEEQA